MEKNIIDKQKQFMRIMTPDEKNKKDFFPVAKKQKKNIYGDNPLFLG